MSSVDQLVDFVRRSKGRVVVRTSGYVPAYLPSGGGDWEDARLAGFFVDEVRNLDSARRVVESGGIVSMFLLNEQSFEIHHYHVRRLSECTEFFRVL